MAKPSKKRGRNEPISVTEIYETIQAREFIQELWWDLISDIQQKPTYKRIKDMVSELLNNSMKNFTSKSVDVKEELKRRTALSEISIMTFTLDTVISEVLYRKYQNEFEDIVKKLIEDLLKNRTKEASNSVEDESVFENIEKIFDKGKPSLKGSDNVSSNTAMHTSINTENHADDINNAPVRKRGRPKKVNIGEEKAETPKKMSNTEENAKNVDGTAKRKRGRPPLNPKTSTTESFANKIKIEKDTQGSDAESEMSVGNISLDSVSSVHTSELSSFEDTVSICSDEGEEKKKHVPLKVANEMYLQGKLSQIYQFGKRSEKFKLIKNASTRSKKTKADNSTIVDSPSRKVLPQRIRKPNSKYNSETMFCDVKDYSSPPPDSASSSSQDEIDNQSPSPKIKRKRSSVNKGIASKSPVPHNVSSPHSKSGLKRMKAINSPLTKSSSKRYDASDLYKPRSGTGNVGSRSTAVTLFST